MSPLYIIYIIGIVVSFIAALLLLHKQRDITISDLCSISAMSLFSWFLFIIVILIKLCDSGHDIVIWKKQEEQTNE